MKQRLFSMTNNLDSSSALEAVWVQDTASSLSWSQNHTKLPELTLPVKKDVASLFVRDVTKKKLDATVSAIDALQKEFVEISNEYQKVSDALLPFSHKILDTSLALAQEKVFFEEKIKTSGLDITYEVFVSIITSMEQKNYFFESFVAQYILWLQTQNATLPKEEQLSNEEIDQYSMNYEQMLQAMFDWITQHYLSISALENILTILNEKKSLEEQKLLDLDKQYKEKYALLMEHHKQLQNVSKQWFLASFESFDSSLSVDDLVSQEKVKQALHEIISLYREKEKFQTYNISWPKSVLFSWSAMTGKTLAAKILASELKRKVYHIRRHDVFSEENTDINLMLTDIFYTIIEHVQEEEEPCVVFLDEVEKMIDSVGKYNTVSQQIIINTIEKNLIAIQKSDLDILVVVALGDVEKNNTHTLDRKVFNQTVDFFLPNEKERKDLFEQYINKYPKSTFIIDNYDALVEASAWQSSSYIRDLLQTCVKNALLSAPDHALVAPLGDKDILSVHRVLQEQRPQKYFGQK